MTLVELVENHGGSATVLTVGPEDALEQLRDALAMGAGSAVHVVAGGGNARSKGFLVQAK